MKEMNILGFVKKKTQEMAQDKAKYEEAVRKSLMFENLMRLDVKEKDVNEGRVEEIAVLCPNLTNDMAKFIYNVVPNWEVFLFVAIVVEKKTSNKYYMVGTNRWIWIINDYCYKIINYNEVYLFEMLKKALMSQVVNFNQIVLTVEDYSSNVDKFIKIVMDKEYRDKEIMNNEKYLCGVIPTYQKLNKIQSGISVDNKGNIVFHDRKKNNIKCVYDDILDYEVLEDQTAVLKKKTDVDSHAIPFAKNSCSRISIRITFKNNTLFMMSILEPSAFYSQYNHTDSIYMNNFKFAKEIIELLEGFKKNE
jgi:hypothetical protein